MGYDLGIDVGTSYTAAAVCRPDGTIDVIRLGPLADNIPTIVYLSENGTLLIGDAAARRVALDPAGAAREFKRRMGDPTALILRGTPYTAQALLGYMVERVVQLVAEHEGEMPRSTVVTHPANWGPYKLELFDQATRTAQIGPVTRISEPHAAATAYASKARVRDGAVVAIYDLGGGTFDAAVLRKDGDQFALLGESVGIEHLGGVDFDQAVFHHVRAALGAKWPDDLDDPTLQAPMVHLRKSCTEAKELLSTDSSVSIPVLLPGLDTTVQLDRRRFEAMIAPRIEDTLAALGSAIASAGMTRDDLDQVVLVGGSSRIPLVAQKLRERFGDLVAKDVDPLFAVAIGAATAAGQRAAGSAAAGTMAPPSAPAAAASLPPGTQPQAPVDPRRDSVSGDLPDLDREHQPAARRQPPKNVDHHADHPLDEVETNSARQSEPVGRASRADTRDVGDYAPYTPASPRRKQLIGAGVAAALLLGGGAWALTRGGGDADESRATDPSVSAPTNPAAGADAAAGGSVAPGATSAPVEPTAPDVASGGPVAVASATDMVLVPANTYRLGSTSGGETPAESTEREINLPEFYIDRYEITNEAYKRFSEVQPAVPAPASWGVNGDYTAEIAGLPVTGVAYEYAVAFCSALGKRLPTEQEWEVAARWDPTGATSREFPWEGTASVFKPELVDDRKTYIVGSNPTNYSQFGVADLAGNAWEYVSGSYDDRVTPTERVLRGGTNDFLRTNTQRIVGDPAKFYMSKWAGFRCAADVATTSPDVPAWTFTAVVTPQVAAEAVHEPVAANEFFDDFRDPTWNSWRSFNNAEARAGFHPLEYFHIETKASNIDAYVPATKSLNPAESYEVSTRAFVDHTFTKGEGQFSFGLGVRMTQDDTGLMFVVDPVSERWTVFERTRADGVSGVDEEQANFIDGGPVGIEHGATVTLAVRMIGAENYEFVINGATVATHTLPGLINGGRGTGMFLRSYENSEQAHVHFDEFAIRQIQ